MYKNTWDYTNTIEVYEMKYRSNMDVYSKIIQKAQKYPDAAVDLSAMLPFA